MPTTAISAELQIHENVCHESRQFVAHALELLGEPTRDETLGLLVDELVANAAEAGATKVHITMARAGRRIRVNVKDDARGTPEVRHPAPTDLRGRGLQIIGSLALDWGTYPLGDLKSVWFEYGSDGDDERRDPRAAAATVAHPQDEPAPA